MERSAMKNRDTHRTPATHDAMKSHLVAEERHDPYRTQKKYGEPTSCPDCGAVYKDGRWQWCDITPTVGARERCPGCRRTADGLPAGELTLGGAFLARHRDEILGLVRNVETREKQEHALERIMAIEERGTEVVVTTTGLHLPRRIGHALENAWKGDLATTYDEGGYFVRMSWRREN